MQKSVSKSTDRHVKLHCSRPRAITGPRCEIRCQNQRIVTLVEHNDFGQSSKNTACVELSDFFAVLRIVGSLFLPLYISIEMDCLPQEGQTFNLRVADSYQYTVGKKIGHGTYGHVLEATRSDNVKASCTPSFGFVDLEKESIVSSISSKRFLDQS